MHSVHDSTDPPPDRETARPVTETRVADPVTVCMTRHSLLDEGLSPVPGLPLQGFLFLPPHKLDPGK